MEQGYWIVHFHILFVYARIDICPFNFMVLGEIIMEWLSLQYKQANQRPNCEGTVVSSICLRAPHVFNDEKQM